MGGMLVLHIALQCLCVLRVLIELCSLCLLIPSPVLTCIKSIAFPPRVAESTDNAFQSAESSGLGSFVYSLSVSTWRHQVFQQCSSSAATLCGWTCSFLVDRACRK